MATIIIRSDEANAAATALTLAAREHTVCLNSRILGPGTHTFDYFGTPRTITLSTLDQLGNDAARVGIVFAEGEEVPAGMQAVTTPIRPELIVIIGGGITAAVEAVQSALRLGIDPSTILHVGAFLVGGNAKLVRSEKHDVLAGFLGPGTSEDVTQMAASIFPRLSLGNATAVALSSINALFHVPPMLLNAMSVERGDKIRFYVEGFGDSVIRLLLALDADRLKVGSALGLELLSVQELKSRYSGLGGERQRLTLRDQVNTMSSQTASLPSTFQHRFLRHELLSSFAPMAELANALDVEAPTLRSVVKIGEILLDEDLQNHATTSAQAFMGLTTATSPAR